MTDTPKYLSDEASEQYERLREIGFCHETARTVAESTDVDALPESEFLRAQAALTGDGDVSNLIEKYGKREFFCRLVHSVAKTRSEGDEDE